MRVADQDVTAMSESQRLQLRRSSVAFIFQWQSNGTAFNQVLPLGEAGSDPIINPKPNWTS